MGKHSENNLHSLKGGEAMRNTYKLICLLGGGASGKDTVRNILIEKHHDKFVPAISHTTRPMRSSETGSEYHFIDEAEFNAMHENGEFVEIREYKVANGDTWYYGYSVEEVSGALTKNNVLMIVDLDGFKELKAFYGEICVGIFLSVTKDIRVRRYLNREKITFDVVEEAVRRIKDDDERAFLGAENEVDFIFQTESSEYSVEMIEKLLEL